MTVELINYAQLAQQAKEEIRNLDLPELAAKQLNDLIDGFIELHQNQSYPGYQWHDFTLRLASISEERYNRFQRIADKVHLSPGRLLNHLMKIVLSRGSVDLSAEDLQELMNKPTVHIQHHRELIITAEMLKELQGNHELVLAHIDQVIISPDIDQLLFSQTIRHIQHCGTISIPSTLSKLSIMTKCIHCKSYEFNQ